MPKNQRIFLKITCLFWLIAKIISYKSWLAYRLYPVIPAFSFTKTFSPAVHAVLFGLSLLSMAIILIRYSRLCITLLFVSEFLSCLLDVTRWQPWEYMYLFILLIYILAGKKYSRINAVLALLIALVYLYSGLHKMNGGFLYSIWEGMVLKSFFGLPSSVARSMPMHYAGVLLAFAEAAAGAGLLLLKDKRKPAGVLILMHLFILVFLGPAGLNYNIVVWPWNIAMILFLYVLFFKEKTTVTLSALKGPAGAATLIFWGLLPILSFLGYWGMYLSSGLYSGNTSSLSVCFQELPESLQPYRSKKDTYNLCNGSAMVTLHSWTVKEMNVMPYPETWYYRKVKEQLQKKYTDRDMKFIMISYPFRDSEEIK